LNRNIVFLCLHTGNKQQSANTLLVTVTHALIIITVNYTNHRLRAVVYRSRAIAVIPITQVCDAVC